MSFFPSTAELYDDICTSCCKTTTIVVLTLSSIILVCVLVPLSVQTLDVKTYGVAYSTVNKYLDNQIQEQGIHAGHLVSTLLHFREFIGPLYLIQVQMHLLPMAL